MNTCISIVQKELEVNLQNISHIKRSISISMYGWQIGLGIGWLLTSSSWRTISPIRPRHSTNTAASVVLCMSSTKSYINFAQIAFPIAQMA